MKRLIMVGALVLVIGVGSIIGYADTAKRPNILPGNRDTNFSTENRDTLLKERMEFRKEEIKEALKNGLITEEEAKQWEEHLDYMENFHNETEFMPGSGCGGFRSNNGTGTRTGYGMHMGGRGMMGGRGF